MSRCSGSRTLAGWKRASGEGGSATRGRGSATADRSDELKDGGDYVGAVGGSWMERKGPHVTGTEGRREQWIEDRGCDAEGRSSEDGGRECVGERADVSECD